MGTSTASSRPIALQAVDAVGAAAKLGAQITPELTPINITVAKRYRRRHGQAPPVYRFHHDLYTHDIRRHQARRS